MTEDDVQELEANLFAMLLLVPEKTLKKDLEQQPLQGKGTLKELSKKYGVDENLMLHRISILRTGV